MIIQILCILLMLGQEYKKAMRRPKLIQSNGEGERNIDFRVGPSLDNIPYMPLE